MLVAEQYMRIVPKGWIYVLGKLTKLKQLILMVLANEASSVCGCCRRQGTVGDLDNEVFVPDTCLRPLGLLLSGGMQQTMFDVFLECHACLHKSMTEYVPFHQHSIGRQGCTSMKCGAHI